MADEFRSPLKPVELPVPPKTVTPAPAIVPLLTAWAGLAVLLAAVIFVFLPGTRHPRQELEHAAAYTPADRFLPIPIYGSAAAMFLGIVVLWQMRKLPRPLPAAMSAQRVQAWVGVMLALLGALIVYFDIALRAPR